MQSFSFLLKHKAGVQNQVDGALSCRHYLLSTMRVNVVGFEIVKGLCKEDPFFAKVWEECSKGPHYPFFLQDGYLFKGNCLCIPHCSLRNFIIIEAHGSGLAGHFGRDKMLAIVKENFYWPKMEKDVMQHLERCRTCHIPRVMAKTRGCTHHFQFLNFHGNL